jgi:hypothetical protein
MAMGPFGDTWTEADVEAVLARGDPNDLLYVPIVVSLTPPDCTWSFNICRSLSTHPDARVRANAILGFGHLARRCGALAPEIGPAIIAALTDPDWDVRGNANEAAHDINHFLGWTLPTLDDEEGPPQ